MSDPQSEDRARLSAKKPPLINIFRRYRRKHEQAMDNYFRNADTNWRRADYWHREAGRWAKRARRQFPWFCG